MDTESVISVPIADLAFTPNNINTPGIKVYVPDNNVKFRDKISAVEFIRETFDLPSTARRSKRHELISRETGSQMLEMLLGYESPEYRIDAMNPYAKINVSDIMKSDTIVPIFDVRRLFDPQDSERETARKTAGFLRNTRDAYVASKFMNVYEDYKTVNTMYMSALRTLLPQHDPVIPVTVLREYVNGGDRGHIIFKDEAGNLITRRKPPCDALLIEPDESSTSNVLGIKHGVNTAAGGTRVTISDGINYGLSGLKVKDASTSAVRSFKLPSDNEQMLKSILEKKTSVIYFVADNSSSGESSIRSLIGAGIESLDAHLNGISSFRDYVFRMAKRGLYGKLEPREIEQKIKASIISPRKTTFSSNAQVHEIESSSLDSSIDDLIRDIFFSIEYRRNSKTIPNAEAIADSEMTSLIREATVFVDGVYYSKFTNNELEFFTPIEEDMTGMSFDEELAFMKSSMNDDDYLTPGTWATVDASLERLVEISGDRSIIERTDKIVGDGTVHDDPVFEPLVHVTPKLYPEGGNGLRATYGHVPRYPGFESSSLGSFSGTNSKVTVDINDSTGLVSFASKIEDWKSLVGPNGEDLEDEKALKYDIVKILNRYFSETELEISSLIERASGISGIDVVAAVMKIGTFDNISEEFGKEYMLACNMRETWRFATAFRQELCMLRNYDFSKTVSTDDSFSTMPEMYQRGFYQRQGLRSVKPVLIFDRLGIEDIPTVSMLSNAFPSTVLSTSSDFADAAKKSRGIALLYIKRVLEVLFEAVIPATGTSKLSKTAQVSVLVSIQRMFVDVISEEIRLRPFTDVDAYSARWVFQELWTESREKGDSLMIDNDSDDTFLENSGVARISENDIDDDETIEEAEDSWGIHDEIAAEISTFISDWDDLD